MMWTDPKPKFPILEMDYFRDKNRMRISNYILSSFSHQKKKDIFYDPLGDIIMRYWGKRFGSLYGTITSIVLNEDSSATITTNKPTGESPKSPMFTYTIDKKTVDALRKMLENYGGK